MDSVVTARSNRPLIAQLSALTAVVVSLVVLAGWFFHIDTIKSILPGFPQMKPNTAVAFVIAGVGLFLSAKFDRKMWHRIAAAACGTFVFLLAMATLGEYLAGSNFGLDTILIGTSNYSPGDQFPGRMSPHSAINFALLGLAVITLHGSGFLHKISEFFAGIITATTFAAILGHLYGAEELYGISNYNGMALHTATLFLICSLACFAANYDSRTVRLLTSDSLGGVTLRRLLPAVIFIPTFVGWLRVVGQEHGLYDTGFGSALTIFVCVLLMCAIVLFICATIHKTDRRRKTAELELAEKEQRFRELFDYGQSMICIHDLEGILTTVNPAALISLGYEKDEVVGKSLREFMPEELRPQFPGFLRQIENEGIANVTFALLAKNGR